MQYRHTILRLVFLCVLAAFMGCSKRKKTDDPPVPTEPKPPPGYVCSGEVVQELNAGTLADPLPPEDELHAQCSQDLGIGSVGWLDVVSNATHLSEFPSCVGWMHYTVADFVNSHSVPLRMQACALYADRRVKERGQEDLAEDTDGHDLVWDNQRVNGIASHLLVVLDQTGCFRGKMRFGVADDIMNAMAYADGSIVIGSPMLDASDAGVAYIIGHEIMHLQWASYDGLMVYLTAHPGDPLAKKVKDLYREIMAFARGPMDEVFVDTHSIQLITMAGYDPSEAVRMINSFGGHDPNSSFRIGETHPPDKMRATLAMEAAREALVLFPPADDVLFQGRTGGKNEPPWIGSPPPAKALACATAFPHDRAQRHAMTWCGSDKAKKPVPADWSGFQCMLQERSPRPDQCKGWKEYATAREHGCPGIEPLCCPTSDGSD